MLCAVAIAFFLSSPLYVSSQQSMNEYFPPIANVSTRWINGVNNTNILQNDTFPFPDVSSIRPIFPSFTIAKEAKEDDNYRLGYACGLYFDGTSDYHFAISIFTLDDVDSYLKSSEVVWSANRNNPVGENATVELSDGGDLLLRDADGTLVWSTNTSGKAVAGLNLTDMGNLVLFDANNSVVWQSFDHPTNCLLPGQSLRIGQNLSEGLYSFSISDQGLVASTLSHPPQVYWEISIKNVIDETYATFRNASYELRASDRTRFMKLTENGHLRVYQWSGSWHEISDVLRSYPYDCNYPMICGRYGIRTNSQCSCPTSSFRQIKDSRPDLGCSEVVPLTCNASDNHTFLDLKGVTYFNLVVGGDSIDYIRNKDVDSCKELCLNNCSCKAAMFVYPSDASNGGCYLPTDIFSFMNNEDVPFQFYSSVSIKIQIAAVETFPPAPAPGMFIPKSPPTVETSSTSLLWPILGSALGIVFVIGIALYECRRRKRKTPNVGVREEDYLDNVPGMPTRFSFQELFAATNGFSNKLSEGGFGSVYEGSLNDGTRIAVKRLEGVRQIKKSFLAEVESIGSIHHINLVTLIGFCAEDSHRLLVYEYMCNGSLEKWIYATSLEIRLDWSKRRKIILDVAKGLAYLHEDCRQKILHLDVKPQNILLDKHYNAKLADFGLSKLIDRNQSQVVTTMRGTPGYLAPEWLNAVITEKVDVYSFGVVVLEILTGRKIFERSRPEEERYLLSLFKQKAEEGQWLDIVDESCQDEECDLDEVEKLMKVSAWCLQSDHGKRPCMSMVMKVMEGGKHVPEEIDYNLLIPRYLISKPSESSSSKDLTPLPPSLLSGPR